MYHTLVFLTYAIILPAKLQQGGNKEQLHMCIQKFREGQVKLTWKGYSAVQVRSEMSPLSQISPTSYQWCVLKQNESKARSCLVLNVSGQSICGGPATLCSRSLTAQQARSRTRNNSL